MSSGRWSEVERLFDAALALPPESRAAFIAEQCAGDDELRHEVESLLARVDSADFMLPHDPRSFAEALAVRSAPDLIGTQLGDYEVQSRIGAGAMGEVYRGRDTRLGREVAIKVLPDAFSSDPERLARFDREGRLLAALNHPNIATIYTVIDADGVRAIVMELIEGPTLAERVDDGPLPLRDALTIARQVADALDAAHRQGIIHRDLKPGNIKVTPRGTVKVLDFGLAKVALAPSDDVTTTTMTRPQAVTVGTTRSGAILGTAAYMSPEQARGRPVDARSDIWAFGCVLFEMLTAQCAFGGETILDSLAVVLQGDPTWQALPRSTPAVVRDLLRRCLQKDPADRPPSMADVRAQLDATFMRRHTLVRRTFTVAAAAVAVVGLTLVGIRYAPSITTRLRTSASRSASSAFNLSQQAAALLERDDIVANVDRAASLLDQAVAVDDQYAPAYAYLADAYTRRHQVSPDAEWLRRAQEAAKRAVELNSDLAAAHVALGRADLESGADADALKEFTRSVELDPVNPLTHLGLANAYAAQSQDQKADAEFRAAIARGPDVWRTHQSYGFFFFQRGRYAEAAREWEAARNVAPDNVVVFRNLGAAYYQLGRYDEAASAFQRALEIEPAAAVYTNLGTLRFFQGRYSDAVSAFEKAVELGANTYLNWGNLADGLRWAPGRRAEAADAYRHAIDLIEKQIAQKPEDGDLLTRHAVYLAKTGEHDRALKEAAAVAARPQLTSPILYRLTTVYEVSGDRVRALKTLQQTLEGGYPAKEIDNDPEFTQLRADVRYHRLIDSVIHAGRLPTN